MNAPPLPRHILVPHDFGDSAQAALEYALELGNKLNARVTIMHSFEFPSVGYPEGWTLTAEVAEDIQRAAADGLKGVVAKARRGAQVEVGEVLREGSPWEEIDAVAKEARVDLIVMGTHGRKGVSRVLLGSVAEKVVRTAPCPVLTIRLPEPAR